MTQRSFRTFAPHTEVTHYFLGDTYIVVESRPHYTLVITNDDDAVDISFPTVDLRPVS